MSRKENNRNFIEFKPWNLEFYFLMPTNENLSPCTSDEDIRSKEVQDIVDRMPTRWAMWTEMGTHDTLMERKGLYYQLVASQVEALQIKD